MGFAKCFVQEIRCYLRTMAIGLKVSVDRKINVLDKFTSNSGGLHVSTGTPISEHDFSFNFNHHISRRLHDIDEEVASDDRSTISLTTN